MKNENKIQKKEVNMASGFEVINLDDRMEEFKEK